VRIWDLENREPIRPPLCLPHFVLGLDFSPDGSQLAVPFGFNNPEGGDGVEILDVESGEQVARLPAENEVRVVAFSPDGGLLATSQIDGTAQLWETDGWRRMGSPLSVGAGFVVSVDFSADGQTLATSHDDGTVALWDVESQELIGSPLPAPGIGFRPARAQGLPGGETWSTAGFSPEGGHLFAVDDNRRAIRWEVDPDLWRQRACTIAGGGFTPEQWDEIVPERDYIEACPSG
jgi:WD40 repeat protein